MSGFDDNNSVVGVGDWFITTLLLSIPIVNIVFFLYWLFGFGNRNKINLMRAVLVWFLISVLIFTIIFVLFGGSQYFTQFMS